MFDLKKPARIKVGGTTYVGPWNNATITRGSMSQALRELKGRYARESVAIYSDRELTAAERGPFRVAAPLFRDADLLVLAAGHPACAGLTMAQARGIAQGRITRWSQVVPGAGGKIAVRYPARGETAELRFGTGYVPYRTSKGVRYRTSYAQGSRGAADGGVSRAAAGDMTVAAITSWSAVRGTAAATCTVPLGGVEPTASSVAALRFPGAYPVDVIVRRRIRDAHQREIVRRFGAYMRSAKVRDQLRSRGLLVAGDPPPA
jgi:ABC-type phosphate transport system substrate-binding protein